MGILQITGVEIGDEILNVLTEKGIEFALIGSTLFANTGTILEEHFESAQNILRFTQGSSNLGAGWDFLLGMDFESSKAFKNVVDTICDNREEPMMYYNPNLRWVIRDKWGYAIAESPEEPTEADLKSYSGLAEEADSFYISVTASLESPEETEEKDNIARERNS